jgi:hypothetical protein
VQGAEEPVFLDRAEIQEPEPQIELMFVRPFAAAGVALAMSNSPFCRHLGTSHNSDTKFDSDLLQELGRPPARSTELNYVVDINTPCLDRGESEVPPRKKQRAALLTDEGVPQPKAELNELDLYARPARVENDWYFLVPQYVKCLISSGK